IEAASVLSIVPGSLIDELIADHDQVVELFEAIRDPARRPVAVQPSSATTAESEISTAGAAQAIPDAPAPHAVSADDVGASAPVQSIPDLQEQAAEQPTGQGAGDATSPSGAATD